jgi:hypothetical protein
MIQRVLDCFNDNEPLELPNALLSCLLLLFLLEKLMQK